MKHIRKVITKETDYDIDDMRSQMRGGTVRILSDVTHDISMAVYQLSASLGYDFEYGQFINNLISLDFAGVKARDIKEIMEFNATDKNTTLGRLRKWGRAGLIYRKVKFGVELYGVNYAQFAQLTGIEIIVY